MKILLTVALVLCVIGYGRMAQAEGDNTGDTSADSSGEICGDASDDEKTGDEPAKDPNVKTVILETSKGDVTFTIHPDWAPIGAAHFLELVNAGYYDGAPFFRVLPGFVAQFGIAADPAVTGQWQDKTIKDEPVKQGNQRGFVAFGKSSLPNSRSTHIFVNVADNTRGLDGQGFAAFAEVTDGMEVVDKLFPADFQDQGALSAGGIEAFQKKFPQGDTIIRAYVKE